ncbi:Multidrug export protein mepA, partial [Dysosmobacter welbionis]
DIDLFELFYCGTGIDAPMTDEELRQVGSFDTAGELICPVDKMSVEAINQVLLENTGLTLEETGRIGMDYFQYLPEYDAYYHSHGDTNYFSGVNITAGERVGDTIRLYYDDTFHVDGWKCVTLEEQADGSYWFVSNQPSERPAIPTVYPEGEPVLTIPLTDLTPYEPETMEAIRHRNDCAERGTGYIMHTEDGDELSVRTYLSTDGNLYAAVIYDEAAGRDGMRTWDVGCFFTFPEHNTLSYSDSGGYAVSMDSFSDLFGHDGLVIRYSGELDEHTGATFHDYYYFDTEGNPVLLARVYGDTAQFDLDGNGADELCASSANTAQIFFQRDGRIYEADIDEDLKQAWPDAEYLSFNRWDVSRRNLALWAFVPIPDSPQDGTADRWLYFDGENLLVYRDGRATADHLMEGAEAPEDVMAVLRDYVQEQYTGDHEGLPFVEGGDFVPAPLEYDDWRIESIEGPSYVSV